MDLSKFGFFNQKKRHCKIEQEKNLNLLIANIKDSNLKRMACVNLQQELHLLTVCNLSKQSKMKQKRLSIRLKFNLRKRRAKKRLAFRNHNLHEIQSSKPGISQ
ncbi:MAG: hypothetical protein H0U70_05040 [Tatlockia sp.]|nr:hypothetical protein [Tatlockia sp.]